MTSEVELTTFKSCQSGFVDPRTGERDSWFIVAETRSVKELLLQAAQQNRINIDVALADYNKDYDLYDTYARQVGVATADIQELPDWTPQWCVPTDNSAESRALAAARNLDNFGDTFNDNVGGYAQLPAPTNFPGALVNVAPGVSVSAPQSVETPYQVVTTNGVLSKVREDSSMRVTLLPVGGETLPMAGNALAHFQQHPYRLFRRVRTEADSPPYSWALALTGLLPFDVLYYTLATDAKQRVTNPLVVAIDTPDLPVPLRTRNDAAERVIASLSETVNSNTPALGRDHLSAVVRANIAQATKPFTFDEWDDILEMLRQRRTRFLALGLLDQHRVDKSTGWMYEQKSLLPMLGSVAAGLYVGNKYGLLPGLIASGLTNLIISTLVKH